MSGNPEHQKIYADTLTTFVNDMSLTLQSFVGPNYAINEMIVYGKYSSIKGLTALIANVLHITVTLWQVQEFIQTQGITIKNKHSAIPLTHLITQRRCITLCKH